MTCSCNSTCCDQCIPVGNICLPQGDATLLVFTVKDALCDGSLIDISGASEIVFVVADTLGGTVRINKALSSGEIDISSNGYQFSLTVTSLETSALVRVSNYYECRLTSAGGLSRTVSAGLFKAPETMIKDIL